MCWGGGGVRDDGFPKLCLPRILYSCIYNSRTYYASLFGHHRTLLSMHA